MSYIKLSDAKNAIMNCIGEQTVSRYATSAECKAARHGADLALFSLDNIPTAAVVEVRHGHWISEEEAVQLDRYDLAYTCSVCGRCDWDCTESKNFNFCPNCGAKMDGGRIEG